MRRLIVVVTIEIVTRTILICWGCINEMISLGNSHFLLDPHKTVFNDFDCSLEHFRRFAFYTLFTYIFPRHAEQSVTEAMHKAPKQTERFKTSTSVCRKS